MQIGTLYCRVQCSWLNEASQPHQQVEEMDQDSRGSHQTAAQVISHRGKMSISQQLLTEHGRGGDSRGVSAAKGQLACCVLNTAAGAASAP